MRDVSRDLEPICAFCGGRRTQVRRLALGLHVAICGDCIEVAREILDDSPDATAGQPGKLDREWLESENRRLRDLLLGKGVNPDGSAPTDTGEQPG